MRLFSLFFTAMFASWQPSRRGHAVMRTFQFTDGELEIIRQAMTEYRKQFAHERRREDVQMVTAIDVVVAKIDGGREGGETISPI
jgi:hypothetical protein